MGMGGRGWLVLLGRDSQALGLCSYLYCDVRPLHFYMIYIKVKPTYTYVCLVKGDIVHRSSFIG